MATPTAVDVVMPQMGQHGGNQVSPMSPLLNGVARFPRVAAPGKARLRRRNL
jgi:hypothetical protein